MSKEEILLEKILSENPYDATEILEEIVNDKVAERIANKAQDIFQIDE